jgi:aspartyl-tRNA(Asn)/glutamyl-tRNA(Gln) amidotransferase subunit B
MDKYIPTIGLEIHAEMKTNSKMFCSCKNDPDESRPNKNICPICLGHPGTLPVLNHEAIRNVIRIGVAVGGQIADFTEWDRKNYFYPDIPKGYQISQYKYPLVSGGSIANIEIERIHLEEDTAQSTHDTHHKSLVNYNRSGVPLMELVTKPVIHDAKSAVTFAKELQLLLRYLGAGEANMEKGEMRVEANISVAKKPQSLNEKIILGTKTEVKNLNSFRAVERAIEYEIERQISLIENSEKVVQETRGWDDKKNETYSQRSKESSHDYRYFPEPDIPKLKISEIKEFSKQSISNSLPELPWQKRNRFTQDYSLNEKEVAIFVDSPALADYYEKITAHFPKDKNKIRLVTNYFLSDYISLLNSMTDQGSSKSDSYEKIITEKSRGYIIPEYFAELIDMISANEISSRGAKEILLDMFNTKAGNKQNSPSTIAKEKDLIQKSNEGDLAPIIDDIISKNPKAITEFKAGKTASLQFLIGQAMKATKGSANPGILSKLFLEKLK